LQLFEALGVGMIAEEKVAIDLALVLLIIVLVWTSLRRHDGD
jgi:hypothetical protein